MQGFFILLQSIDTTGIIRRLIGTREHVGTANSYFSKYFTYFYFADCTWKMTADSAENPNMLLPDEMNLLIEMMKSEKYFNGSNAELLERYNAYSGKNLSARILKRMLNKWKYDLNDNHIYFKSYKENNIRKVEIKYDFEIDNSDSEYVRYDKYDENTAV